MTTRNHAPAGAPTWVDLWTSDIDRSRTFYPKVFGWEAGEVDPAFGGYFQFMHNGAPIAGGMGDMPGNPADNTWKAYFNTADISAAASAVSVNGGTAFFEPDAVGDLGSQFVFADPQGATAGAWQPDTFAGFTTLGEPGAPSWFELHTPDHAGALAFYAEVFGWEYDPVSDTDEFRYTMVDDPEGDMGMAGIMDSRNDLAEGEAAFWTTYWEVADVDATIVAALEGGAKLVNTAEDTPYGRLAVVADPMGAKFSLRASPRP